MVKAILLLKNGKTKDITLLIRKTQITRCTDSNQPLENIIIGKIKRGIKVFPDKLSHNVLKD